MLEEQSLVYAIILVIFSIVFSLISNWLFRKEDEKNKSKKLFCCN